jgi:hypothetical protein
MPPTPAPRITTRRPAPDPPSAGGAVCAEAMDIPSASSPASTSPAPPTTANWCRNTRRDGGRCCWSGGTVMFLSSHPSCRSGLRIPASFTPASGHSIVLGAVRRRLLRQAGAACGPRCSGQRLWGRHVARQAGICSSVPPEPRQPRDARHHRKPGLACIGRDHGQCRPGLAPPVMPGSHGASPPTSHPSPHSSPTAQHPASPSWTGQGAAITPPADGERERSSRWELDIACIQGYRYWA